MEEIWNYFVGFLEDGFGQYLIRAITLLFIGIVVIKIVKALLKKVLLRSPLENSLVTFFMSILTFVMYVVLFMLIASTLQIPMTSFVVITTALSLAVSLALQGSLSNMANGVVILSTKPFKEGDFVEIDGVSGTVKAIRMLNTKLLTPDNKTISIPNSTIISSKVINYSASSIRRVDMTFGVAYGVDVEEIKSIIMGVIVRQPEILHTPEPFVRLGEQAASSLNFYTRVWVASADYWTVYFNLNEQVLKAFNENKIEVPFNQLDVHIKNEEVIENA